MWSAKFPSTARQHRQCVQRLSRLIFAISLALVPASSIAAAYRCTFEQGYRGTQKPNRSSCAMPPSEVFNFTLRGIAPPKGHCVAQPFEQSDYESIRDVVVDTLLNRVTWRRVEGVKPKYREALKEGLIENGWTEENAQSKAFEEETEDEVFQIFSYKAISVEHFYDARTMEIFKKPRSKTSHTVVFGDNFGAYYLYIPEVTSESILIAPRGETNGANVSLRFGYCTPAGPSK